MDTFVRMKGMRTGFMWIVIMCACFWSQCGSLTDSDTVTHTKAEWKAAKYAKGFRWYVQSEFNLAAELSNPRTGEVWAVVWRDSIAFKNFHQYAESVPHVVARKVDDRGIATLSTTHVALMSSWDEELSNWAGGGYIQYLQNPNALAKIASGQAHDFSGQPELNKEKLVAAKPGALTIYPFGDPLEGTAIGRHIPVVPIGEYLEPHPLGRAEWMVLLGWLCGHTAEAQQRFDVIVSAYADVQDKLKFLNKEDVPKVFAGSMRNGVWHAPGGGSLVAQLIRDAGADYLFDAKNGEENIEVSLEMMMVMGEQADALGVVWEAPDGLSQETLLESDARYASVIPRTKKVFGANAAECDYFGSWVARPHDMLRNLAHLFHPDEVDAPADICFQWLSTDAQVTSLRDSGS